MAITLGKSPIIFTEAGDEIPQDGRNWCVANIRMIATDSSGTFIILDKSGGREIVRSSALNVGEAEDVVFDAHWFDGFYIQQCPGRIYVYYK